MQFLMRTNTEDWKPLTKLRARSDKGRRCRQGDRVEYIRYVGIEQAVCCPLSLMYEIEPTRPLLPQIGPEGPV